MSNSLYAARVVGRRRLARFRKTTHRPDSAKADVRAVARRAATGIRLCRRTTYTLIHFETSASLPVAHRTKSFFLHLFLSVIR